MANIFISYAREDIEIVRRLNRDLKLAGFFPWFDDEKILPGQNWRHEIKIAIKKCDYFIAILSKHSIDKIGFVQKELKIALDIFDLFPNSKIFLIPVRLEECFPTNETLQDLHWADLFPNYEDGLNKILITLRFSSINMSNSEVERNDYKGNDNETIIENREYLEKFQVMLAHGTMEPLQIVRMYLQLVKQENDPEKIRKLVENADASLEMSQSALGSLLTIERGKDRVYIERIDIIHWIMRQINLFKTFCEEENNIKLNVKKSKQEIYIHTDKTILMQIINNLIGNSVRHLQQVHKADRIIEIQIQKELNVVDIYISDTGEGLPQEVKLFLKKPFYPGASFPRGGLGLGFSREMANMIGGNLKLLSSDKIGTKFQLSIPFGENKQ